MKRLAQMTSKSEGEVNRIKPLMVQCTCKAKKRKVRRKKDTKKERKGKHSRVGCNERGQRFGEKSLGERGKHT